MAELIDQSTLGKDIRSRQPPVIVDVRDAAEYAVGHLPGAVNVPLDQLQSRVAEISPDRRVVVY